jgi:signal transduction histidine kinase
MAGSLRHRLLGLTAASIAITLLAAGAALVLVFESHILKRVEQELDIRWTELAKAFEIDRQGEPLLNHDPADPRYRQPYGAAYWQITENGNTLMRSRSLWDEALVTSGVAQKEKERGAFEIEGPNKAELYVIERDVTLQGASGQRQFVLAVALDHADVVELRQNFAWNVAGLLTLMALLLGLGAWLQVRLGLKPMATLRTSLADVRAGRVERFNGQFPNEVQPLVDDLNILLDSQDTLVRKARARARAGALAHGLKTPLTILSGEIARLERSGQSARAAALKEQCEIIRLQVERELARARTHGAVVRFGTRPHVRPIIERLVDLMRRVDSDGRLAWTVSVPADVQTVMESADFAEVVGNLVDNARKWARKSIAITVTTVSGRRILSIADDGPGVIAGKRDEIMRHGVHFGRDGDGSSGLGLAIVSDILAEYDLRLIVEDAAPGCRIMFDIGPDPSAPPVQGAPDAYRNTRISRVTSKSESSAAAT